jgi:predicted GH43/DUF377 family glycosyl hydrolase
MKNLFILLIIAFLYSVKSKINSLFQFVVVKKSDEPPFRELYENYQKSLLENAKKDGADEVVVFHHRKKSPSASSSSHPKIDHKDGTAGSPKTVYFLKHNRLKTVSDFKTFENLGFKVDDIAEITENQFNSFQFSSEYLPVYRIPPGEPIDAFIGLELYKSRFLQEIFLTNITEIGYYINPSLVPFRGRLFLATGLAWGMHDNHNFNEHLEFRWFNNSLLPFSSFSSIRPPLATPSADPNQNIPDPNLNDTYYEGINEQHISNLLQNQPIFGEDPRVVPINDDEAYIVFTNRFHNPLVMGIALLQYNKEKKQIEITRVKTVIHPAVNAGEKNKNWSPFLLPSSASYSSSASDSQSSADHLHHPRHSDHTSHNNSSHFPHSHHPLDPSTSHRNLRTVRSLTSVSISTSSSSSASASKDLHLIQYVNPLTINKVKYSDLMDSSTIDSTGINAELVSQASFVKNLHWSYGHIRGGTNAIYLKKQNIFLSFFHCVSDVPQSFHYYLFGAYTFTTLPSFQLLSYTPYPIMNDELYTGPWMSLNKNRRIIYVVFPETIFLHLNEEDGEEEIILSFGFQDMKGFFGRIKLNQLLENLTPIEETEEEEKNKKK